MPSCQVCGKWFSEEDNGCGCDGESIWMTRKELRMVAARVLRDFADRFMPSRAGLLRHVAAEYEAGKREVPSE